MDLRTKTAKERAAHFEQEAEKYCRMTTAEPVEHMRRELFGLADHDERGISDNERARRCDDVREVRDKIAVSRPTTLRGVLAALEMASEVDDSDYWPEGAIEGLRDIAKA